MAFSDFPLTGGIGSPVLAGPDTTGVLLLSACSHPRVISNNKQQATAAKERTDANLNLDKIMTSKREVILHQA
jgi:hypothetical protein